MEAEHYIISISGKGVIPLDPVTKKELGESKLMRILGKKFSSVQQLPGTLKLSGGIDEKVYYSKRYQPLFCSDVTKLNETFSKEKRNLSIYKLNQID